MLELGSEDVTGLVEIREQWPPGFVAEILVDLVARGLLGFAPMHLSRMIVQAETDDAEAGSRERGASLTMSDDQSDGGGRRPFR